MEVINDKMPIYQVFTDPSVYGYMWSLHPRLRNDIVYKLILSLFKTDLSDIPWARTGLPYGSNNGEPDQFTNELLSRLYDMIISDSIKAIGIFNMNVLKSVLNLIKRFPTHNFDYLERLLWIASLSEMQKLYKFEVEDIFKYRLKDRINSIFYVQTEYTLKYLYRKLNK
jgi:asparagine synthase (glutamine-hydrolysing)